MKIVLAKNFDAKVMEKLTNLLDRPRHGIHVSDLIYGLRKGYFNHIERPKTTRKSALNFTRGRALEEWLTQCCARTQVRASVAGDIYATLDGITSLGAPVEAKTTKISSARITTEGVENACPQYLTQLKAYCVAVDRLYGFLAIFTMNDPELLCYKVIFERQELDECKATLIRRKKVLMKAMRTGKTPHAKWCPYYPFECSFCDYAGTEACEDFETRRAVAIVRVLMDKHPSVAVSEEEFYEFLINLTGKKVFGKVSKKSVAEIMGAGSIALTNALTHNYIVRMGDEPAYMLAEEMEIGGDLP